MMKLSEAIRLGAMMKPQGKKALYIDGHTCALGAALDAVGKLNINSPINLNSSEEQYKLIRELWPIVCITHRKFGLLSTQVIDLIWTMNDDLDWTRERIADWIESIEKEMEDAQLVKEVPVMVSSRTSVL